MVAGREEQEASWSPYIGKQSEQKVREGHTHSLSVQPSNLLILAKLHLLKVPQITPTEPAAGNI